MPADRAARVAEGVVGLRAGFLVFHASPQIYRAVDSGEAHADDAEFNSSRSDRSWRNRRVPPTSAMWRLDVCLLIQLAVGKGPPDRYKHEFAVQGAFL